MYVLVIFKFSCLLLNFQLHHGSDMACGDDAGNLKWAVVGWIDEMYGPSDSPLKISSKAERGFKNHFIGHLLCPSEWSWDDQK